MAILTSGVNWLAVGLSTVICFMLGAVWYSKYLFGEKWAEGAGVPFGPEAKQPVPALLLQLLGTFLLAWLVGIAVSNEAMAVALLMGTTASVLLMSGSLFGQNNMYATVTEGGFVIAMVLIMVGCQLLL